MTDEQKPEGAVKVKLIARMIWKVTRDYVYPALRYIGKLVFIALWWLLKQLWRWTQAYVTPFIKRSYKRVPRKRTIAVSLMAVLGVSIVTSYLAPYHVPSPAFFKSRVMKESSQTVSKLLNGTWEEQQEAVSDTLQRVGFQVMDSDAMPAAHTAFILPPEITLLADDANRKSAGSSRLTLDEFTYMLSDFGFPFAEDQAPVQLMQSGLRNWVMGALKDPKADGAEAALFLQAMALQQVPAIDLTSDEWDPLQYRLSYLEMQVFLGAFIQAAQPDDNVTVGGLIHTLFGARTAYAADAPGACTYAQQWFNQLGENHDVGALAKFNTSLVGMLASELTGAAIDLLGAVAKNALAAISAAMKVMKLGMLYWSVDLTVEASEEELHKPKLNGEETDITYTARAGVNEAKYKEYAQGWAATPLAKQVKDCLSFVGIPMPTDTGDIAADVENWSIEWDIVRGGGTHALIGLEKNNFDFKGQFQMKLKKVDKLNGEAKLVTDVTEEKVRNHEGYERSDYVVVRALLETSAPPAVGVLLNGGKNGADASEKGFFDLFAMADNLIEVAAGWFQEMKEPEAFGGTLVKYHTEEYPEYTYTGWVSVGAFSSYSSSDSGGSETKDKTQIGYEAWETSESSGGGYTGRWNVTITPSYTSYDNRTDYKIEGEGTVKLIHREQSRHWEEHECIGGLVTTTMTSSSSLNDTAKSIMGGTMILYGSDEDGYSAVFSPYADGYSGEYEITTTRTYDGEGCVYASNDSDTEVDRNMLSTDVSLSQFDAVMVTDAVYPEMIKGSHTTDEGEHWSWSLRRVGSNPKGK